MLKSLLGLNTNRFAFKGVVCQIPDAWQAFRSVQGRKLRGKLASSFLAIPETFKRKVIGEKLWRRYLESFRRIGTAHRKPEVIKDIDQFVYDSNIRKIVKSLNHEAPPLRFFVG